MNPVPLIDSHCHLNYDYSPKSVADLVREAADAGVTHLMTIGTDIPSMPMVQAISQTHEFVFHTVGVHPHDVSAVEDADLLVLEKAAAHPKCRAIGEIGLDYHYDHSPREVQIRRLNDQLDLARKLELPVVIHSREGEADLLVSLKNYAGRLPSGRIPGVIHCFTGTENFARECLALGFYISFSGILTFKNATELQGIAKLLPLDRLLVETDSPYLAPVPFRGKKCEPSMVRHTALKLAELRGLTLEEVAAQTTSNSRRVFHLS